MTNNSMLQHDFCVLSGPSLADQAIGLLYAGAELRPISQRDGFTQIALTGNQRGYIPSALCTPLPASGSTATVQVAIPAPLQSTPSVSTDSRILLQPTEQFRVVAITGKFAAIRREDGQGGYVPRLLLTQDRIIPGYTQLKQAVMIYAMPMPGGQLVNATIVAPGEQLQLLGRDRYAVLVQRTDGQIGFIAAALVQGAQDSEALLQIGPVDLGWILVGGGWGLVNWIGLGQAIISGGLVPSSLQWLLMLVLVLAICVAILRYGRLAVQSRSFGIGALLSYLLLFLVSKGF